MKNKIRKELINLGYSPIRIGTKYMVEIIYYIFKNIKDIDNYSIELVYKIVANKLKINCYTLKSNIVKVTDQVNSDYSPKLIVRYIIDNMDKK